MTLPSFRAYTRVARLFIVALTIFAFGVAGPATLMNLYLNAAGFSPAYIGLWHSASQFGGLILALPAVLVFQLIGRPRALWIGPMLSIGTRWLTVISTQPDVIVIAEGLSGFGTVLFGFASVSLLADASSERERASLFGVSDGSRTLALVIGSVVAGVLPGLIAPMLVGPNPTAESYRVVLNLSYAVRMLGVIPMFIIARDWMRSPDTREQPSRPRVLHYMDPRVLVRQRPQIYVLAVPLALAFLADSLIFPFFNLLMTQRYGMDDAVLGVVIGVRGLIVGVALFAVPLFASRIGYVRGVLGAFLALMLVYAVLGASANVVVAVAASFVQVALFAMSIVLYRVYFFNTTPRADFFFASCVMGVAMNVGPAVSPIVSGVIQQRVGFEPLFVLGIALLGAAAGAFVVATRLARPRPAAEPAVLGES